MRQALDEPVLFLAAIHRRADTVVVLVDGAMD